MGFDVSGINTLEEATAAVRALDRLQAWGSVSIAKVMSRVRSRAMVEDFFGWALDEFGYHRRKAQDMVIIGRAATVHGSAVERAMADLGYGRLAILGTLLEDADDPLPMIERAKKLNARNLRVAVRDRVFMTSAPLSSDSSTITICVSSQQRRDIERTIAKAKKDHDTDSTAAAWVAVCRGYDRGNA